MPYVNLDFPPGMFRAGTERQSEGRWYDCNQIRFWNGLILPRASGAKFSASAVTGKGRRIIQWRDNSLNRWIVVGTHSNLYAIGSDGILHDITPAGFTTGVADAPTDGNGFATGEATVPSLELFGQYLVFCTDADQIIYE